MDATYSSEDLDTEKFDEWNALVSYSKPSASPAGTYGTNQTIAFDWVFIIDYIEFQIVDTQAYDASGE